MAEHKHGSMDISDQEKTFAGFVKFATWGAGISIGVLIFMALVNV
ncbi:MAG: aa3-type cytochrome c oxidase subunit IV [Paracoccaceae bacterium]|jgi:hypothetical protein